MLLLTLNLRPRSNPGYGVPGTVRAQRTYVRDDVKLQKAVALTRVVPSRTKTVMNSFNQRVSETTVN